MNQLVILILFLSSLQANDIVGVWKFTSITKRPFNFASTIGYTSSFQFNANGTMKHLANSVNVMGSVRYYVLNGNQLTVMLKNPNMNSTHNMALDVISSKTFVLQSIGSCYKGIDLEDKNNIFTMCRE